MHKNSLKKNGYKLANYILYFLTCIIIMALIYSRGQDVNWDLQNYHFYSGYSIVDGRYAKDIAASKMQTYLYPIANIPTYFLYRYMPFPFGVWAIFLIQSISIPIIYKISTLLVPKNEENEFLTWITRVIVVGICILSPIWISELGTSFFSSTTAILILGGLYLYLLNKSRYSFFISGVIIGLAVSLKLTNAVYAMGMIITLILTGDNNYKARFVLVASFVFGLATGLLSAIWWHLFLFIQWESPLFPFYNSFFKSQFFPEWSWKDPVMVFNSIGELYEFVKESFFGTNKASEVPFADPRLAIGLISAFAYICCGKKSKIHTRTIFLFLTSFTIWAWLFAYQRYLIPIELLLGVVIYIGLFSIIKSCKWVLSILIIIFTLVIGFINVPDWGHRKMNFFEYNNFGIKLNEREINTPALYVTYGVPMSYIFPYFESNSRFYSYGLSDRMNSHIDIKILKKLDSLPIRSIATNSDFAIVKARLINLGYITSPELCNTVNTALAEFLVCEFRTGELH